MQLPQPKTAEPWTQPYVGAPAPNVEVVPVAPGVGEPAPPPGTPPRPAAAREIVFTNLLRKAVLAYYGNVAYYFRVLRANGLQGTEVYQDGDEVALPARASAAAMAEAERWRARLGERS